MDGYAVREDDLGRAPAILSRVGESFPGAGWDGELKTGECCRIFTGAPLPRGADRVIVQENVRCDGGAVRVEQAPGADRHIRRRGSDFARGDELVAAGRPIDARAIVAAAAADLAQVNVHRRPRVNILSTGDELAEPGTAAARDAAIPDSVSFGIAALASDWGAQVIGRHRVGDELESMERVAVAAVSGSDVVIVTGGASVGERDFAKAMFEPAGLQLIFSKVAIKPGKPVWFGRVGDALVMGLPGNPTSALVTARLLLAPLLAGLAGRTVDAALQWRSLPLAAPLECCGERETFHRARLADGSAAILPNQDSSAQKALVEADLLVRQCASSPALRAGDQADALDF